MALLHRYNLPFFLPLQDWHTPRLGNFVTVADPSVKLYDPSLDHWREICHHRQISVQRYRHLSNTSPSFLEITLSLYFSLLLFLILIIPNDRTCYCPVLGDTYMDLHFI